MSGKPVFPTEKEIVITREKAPYAPEDQIGKYVFKRWTWRQKTEAQLEASEIIDEKKGILKLNLADYFTARIRRCIKEAPPGLYEETERGKEVTAAKINGLDPDVGDIVRDAVDELTGPTPEEKTAFLGQSDRGSSTPG